MQGADERLAIARQGRQVAIVIAVAGLLWVAANYAGRAYGWAPSLSFLFDLAALAAFVWALVVAWRLWRRQASLPAAPAAPRPRTTQKSSRPRNWGSARK